MFLCDFRMPAYLIENYSYNTKELLFDRVVYYVKQLEEIKTHCAKPDNKLLSAIEVLINEANKFLAGEEINPDIKGSEAKKGWAEGCYETAKGLVDECLEFLQKANEIDEEVTVIYLKCARGKSLPLTGGGNKFKPCTLCFAQKIKNFLVA